MCRYTMNKSLQSVTAIHKYRKFYDVTYCVLTKRILYRVNGFYNVFLYFPVFGCLMYFLITFLHFLPDVFNALPQLRIIKESLMSG